VVQAIRRELETLPHVGAALPATWKRVRERLEQDQWDYISVDQYLGICGEHGFKRPEDALQLSGYLHDLGICLHFQDDPALPFTGCWTIR
jgi:internalin A